MSLNNRPTDAENLYYKGRFFQREVLKKKGGLFCPPWFIHNIQSCSENKLFSLESRWLFQLSAIIFNARLARGTKYTAMSRYEPRWLSLFHNFFQILNILVIKPSYSINDIMLQPFYPLAVYALANDITYSIRTAWA